ncbi:gamma-butyrobetaine dioxygenase [Nannochloropsis oceanica]
MRNISLVKLHQEDGIVEVAWQDGARGLFHGAWLRDNCSKYFDPSGGQRIQNTLNLGADAYILTQAMSSSLAGENASTPSSSSPTTPHELFKVTWKDGFSHAFPSAWLRQHCFETRQYHHVQPRLWGRDLVSYFPGHVLPTIAHSDVVKVAAGKEAGWEVAAHGFVQWITHLRDYGVALVEGVPTVPGTVMRMADLIAYHRKTHYGDSFQVVSARKPKHLAYTPVELEVHTDLNYRESSPGIQLLHCLASDAQGGESTFVDGFLAAETLRRESPEDFATLCEVPIPFKVKDGSGFQYYKIPTICVDDAGQLVEVHFNERTRGPLELPAADMARVYRALAHFQEIACRPDLCVEVKMKAGDMVAFNNRRILHGRKAFDPRTGLRHLEGTYVDMDEFGCCLRKNGITPLGIVRAQGGRGGRGMEGSESKGGGKKRAQNQQAFALASVALTQLGQQTGDGRHGKATAPRASL